MPNDESRPGESGSRTSATKLSTSVSLGALTKADRERLLDRLAELGAYDRLARERGLLAEVAP